MGLLLVSQPPLTSNINSSPHSKRVCSVKKNTRELSQLNSPVMVMIFSSDPSSPTMLSKAQMPKEIQPVFSSLMKPKPRPSLVKLSAPTNHSAVLNSLNTSALTGLKPGDISMSTSVALLNSSRPQVSSDSSPQTNT